MGREIVVGLGNNIDYEITWQTQVYEDMIRAYRIRPDELSAEGAIQSQRDMVCSILGFLRSGQGGERFVQNPRVIEDFAARFERKVTLGGTGVRAAIAMEKLGVHPRMHLVSVNPQIRALLPPGCPYICSGASENHYPHLIVQFPSGAHVQAGEIDIRAKCPNRLIYNHNPDVMSAKISPLLRGFLRDAGVLLIAGFNAMHDAALLTSRLDQLKDMLTALPSGATVYMEDGGYYDARLRDMVLEALCPATDIYGMNEDEMQQCIGWAADLLDAPAIRAAIGEIQRKIPVPTLFIHTRYWALAAGKVTPAIQRALLGGIVLATTRFRKGDAFTQADCEATARFPAQRAGVRFAREIHALTGAQVYCLPSFDVPEHNATTIGLGDAFVGGVLPHLLAPD